MILPTKAKETEAYIYIVKEDAAAIKAAQTLKKFRVYKVNYMAML